MNFLLWWVKQFDFWIFGQTSISENEMLQKISITELSMVIFWKKPKQLCYQKKTRHI
jgi:hypothetical protein